MARKKWADMTREQRKVAVAKDVLVQLEAKKFKPTPGVYFELETKTDGPEDLRSLIKGTKKKCEVCAIGAVFAAKVLKENSIEATSYVPYGASKDVVGFSRGTAEVYVDDAFTSAELDLIEDAFEDWGHYGFCAKFAKYRSPTGRLRALMQYLIDNKGVLPPQHLAEVDLF